MLSPKSFPTGATPTRPTQPSAHRLMASTRPRGAPSARPLAVEEVGVNARAEAMECRLQWPVTVAALLTIPAIAIEQSSVGQPWDTIATVLNWTIWLAFLAETVLMLGVVVDSRSRWLRDH